MEKCTVRKAPKNAGFFLLAVMFKSTNTTNFQDCVQGLYVMRHAVKSDCKQLHVYSLPECIIFEVTEYVRLSKSTGIKNRKALQLCDVFKIPHIDLNGIPFTCVGNLCSLYEDLPS